MVLKFINDFKSSYINELETVFSFGYCYWFAFILKERFDGEIYYLPIENHFITKIEDNYYDIKGRVDISKTKCYNWNTYQEKEPIDSERLKRYCIDKLT